MRIFFPETDPQIILETLHKTMGGRALSKIVSFDVSEETLIVTISKLGTSTLEFSRTDREDGIEFHMVKEKIALGHRALKGEVKSKIFKIIEKSGGTID